MIQHPHIQYFFDEQANTFSYVVSILLVSTVQLLIGFWIMMRRQRQPRPRMQIKSSIIYIKIA